VLDTLSLRVARDVVALVLWVLSLRIIPPDTATVQRLVVGRYAGEELIMLLPGALKETGQIIAAEISRVLADAPALPGIVFPTVSYSAAGTASSAHTLGCHDAHSLDIR